ncbi:MAG: hypothetical protein NC184_07295 [Roseburia sp.]|nr:hypothetical protein [Roseburia sp.]
MAKNTENKKKKQNGFVRRMMFGNENKPDLTAEQMNMSKWAMFKYLFFHRFGTMVMLNLLTCIFAIPAVIVVLLFYSNITVNNGLIPYSSNLVIGYPVVIDAMQQGTIAEFTYTVMEYLCLAPCISVLALGVAGNFYVMRKLMWEETTSTAKDFFRGIGKCWLPAVIMGLVVGLSIELLKFSLGYFDAYGQSTSLKAVCVTLSIILLVFITLFGAFFMTQNAAFKMRPMVLVRNSVLFVLGTNIQAVFFVGIGIAPAFLALIPGITLMLTIVYVLIGFSYSTLVITLFCHRCYEKFLYDKIDTPDSVYAKRPDDIADQAEKQARNKQRKQAAAPYKNPKKRKKSIDEGSDITPLAPTFRREDLQRLEKEHEQILNESADADDGDAENPDMDDELGELEGDGDLTAPDIEQNASAQDAPSNE